MCFFDVRSIKLHILIRMQIYPVSFNMSNLIRYTCQKTGTIGFALTYILLLFLIDFFLYIYPWIDSSVRTLYSYRNNVPRRCVDEFRLTRFERILTERSCYTHARLWKLTVNVFNRFYNPTFLLSRVSRFTRHTVYKKYSSKFRINCT